MKKIGCILIGMVLMASASNAAKPVKKSEKATKAPVAISVGTNNAVLADVAGEKITYDELEKAFRKNMNRKNVKLSDVPKDSVMDFLNLYVNYRLKVKDAVSRGFAKDSAVQADIEQNRRILAESFYFEKKLTEPKVELMTKQRQKEIKIAIILCTFMQNPSNRDTTDAFKRAMDALKRVKGGEPFELVAKQVSDDKPSGAMGGEIPNFLTSGKIQRPIEEAMYSLKAGEIYPELIATKYGYFVLKVLAVEPRITVYASHILIPMEKDSIAALAKTESLLNQLKNGARFSELAVKNSGDPASAAMGGSLGEAYSRSTGLESSGRPLVQAFETALFNLKDGEMSGVVKSEFGYHIILRDSSKAIDFNKEREDLKKIYKRAYFQEDKDNLIDKLAQDNGFKMYEETIKSLGSILDTTKTNLEPKWADKIDPVVNKQAMFEVKNKTYTVKDFVELLNSKPEFKGMALNEAGLKRSVRKMVEPIVFDEATKNLENEYSDFATLMGEFRDGILLFKVEALEVWDRLKFDSAAAKKYYEAHKGKWMTDDMFNISEIYVVNDTLAKEIYARIQKGEDFDKLAGEFTQRIGFREKNGKWGPVSAVKNDLGKNAMKAKAKTGDVLEPKKFEKGWSIVKINAYEAPRPKTFEEAIPDFAPEFQEMTQKNLSSNWLDGLKKKFPVKINEAEVKNSLKN